MDWPLPPFTLLHRSKSTTVHVPVTVTCAGRALQFEIFFYELNLLMTTHDAVVAKLREDEWILSLSAPEKEVTGNQQCLSNPLGGKARGRERKRGRAQRKKRWTKSVRNCDVTPPAGTQVNKKKTEKKKKFGGKRLQSCSTGHQITGSLVCDDLNNK